MKDLTGTSLSFAGVSRRSNRSSWHSSAGLVATLGALVLLAGCDGGGGGSGGTGGSGGSGGTGGTGGSGGTGGGAGGGTTTMPAIDACPTGAEAHALALVIDPSGTVLWTAAADVTGTVAAAGLDAPPSAECGSGMAWVTITEDGGGGDWTACFQAPGLVWSFAPGDPVELAQTADEHPIAPASVHTTLRSAGALVAHVEWTMYEDELALPDGLTVAKADLVCDSPADSCLTRGYSVTASANGESTGILPGESGVVGGLRVDLDHYWILNVSSACDGGNTHIRISVTPAPAE